MKIDEQEVFVGGRWGCEEKLEVARVEGGKYEVAGCLHPRLPCHTGFHRQQRVCRCTTFSLY